MTKYSSVLKTVILAVVVVVVCFYFVASRESDRFYSDIENIKQKRLEAADNISGLNQQSELPLLLVEWKAATIIAAQYEVVLLPLKGAEESHIKNHDLPGGSVWYGVLQGATSRVMLAALELQSRLPVTYGVVVIGNSVSGLTVALSGSPTKQENNNE